MTTIVYSDQWMSDLLPNNDTLLDSNLLNLKKIFFEEMNHHSFSDQRIIWLYRWLGMEYPIEHYQNDNFLDKKVKLLKELWTKEYFHPFLTTDRAVEKIRNHKDKYVIGLSSTIPGSIRISYWKDGVKHHRIDLQIHKTSQYLEIIEYDFLRLEMAIEKLILNYSLSKITCDYNS
jgi:hypothetical protein